MPRGLRYPTPGSTSSIPLRNLFWSALPCSLARTAYATTPSDGTASNVPDCARGLSSAIPLGFSDGSDDGTQVGDNGGDGDFAVSLDSHTSPQLPDDQSINCMLDSTTSDEVGVVSVDLATDSETSTMLEQILSIFYY